MQSERNARLHEESRECRRNTSVLWSSFGRPNTKFLQEIVGKVSLGTSLLWSGKEVEGRNMKQWHESKDAEIIKKLAPVFPGVLKIAKLNILHSNECDPDYNVKGLEITCVINGKIMQY